MRVLLRGSVQSLDMMVQGLSLGHERPWIGSKGAVRVSRLLVGHRISEGGMCCGRADVAIAIACSVRSKVVGELAECPIVLPLFIFVLGW